MSGMSRRDLLRASAGAAAVAVPMSLLASHGAGASAAAAAATGSVRANAAEGDTVQPAATVDVVDVAGPVMFSVRDARTGEVSILHGQSEVIVRDRQLVDRILRAAQRAVV
jgi:hypothetical protein